MAKSIPSTSKKHNPDYLALLECPVCLDTLTAPIFLCQTGHSLCNSCTKNLTPPICPICRQKMTQMRNWQLEGFVSDTKVQKNTKPICCPNKSSGCILKFPPQDMDKHLKRCIFRNYICPFGAAFGKCSWSGKKEDLSDHVEDDHPNNFFNYDDQDIVINNVSTTVGRLYIYVINEHDELFIFTLKIDTSKKMAYWVVQCVGTEKVANKYIYEITVTSEQDQQRKVCYSEICFSDSHDINDIFHNGKCGLMPLEMMNNFIKKKKVFFNIQIDHHNV